MRRGRIGNNRYDEVVSLLKRHDSGFDETVLLSSELLRVVKDLLESDKIEITIDEPGAL
jgi:hypothetical protein